MKIPRKKSRADVPSMAMGDIAFNLLIFFVIAYFVMASLMAAIGAFSSWVNAWT